MANILPLPSLVDGVPNLVAESIKAHFKHEGRGEDGAVKSRSATHECTVNSIGDGHDFVGCGVFNGAVTSKRATEWRAGKRESAGV